MDTSYTTKNITDYRDTADIIADIYMGEMTYYSITLDLIGMYLKVQKFIYVEAKTFCEYLLYSLMLPTIFISSVCTVLSIALKNYKYGAVIVSILTGYNSFILSVITYLKLDAKAEAHKTTANQFDKLQIQCEFFSGRTLMIKDHNVAQNVTEFVDLIENKIKEIKEANQFIIPEKVRTRYSEIYSFNVFSVIKKYKTTLLTYTQQLINVLNQIENRHSSNNTQETILESQPLDEDNPQQSGNFLNRIKNVFSNNNNIHEELNIYSNSTDLEKLLLERDTLINKILEYRNHSAKLNEHFDHVIETKLKQKNTFSIFTFLKN
jgi:hypothetical protein